jgi:pimeloyl-ACP methyl ester carboxylesterase
LVVVADGAGDFRATSNALRQAVASSGEPLTVETFAWSHGYLRILADQLDRAHARREGSRLAELVCAYRQAYPETPISLVGHSAGSVVILAAAESLPPECLDRIILFAPALPADYDLRPALHSVRKELDVFCSLRDYWYLEIGMCLTALTQGHSSTPAGYSGFFPRPGTAEDAQVYGKLRQFPWEPRLAWTGHEGGHFGWYQQGYLRNFVLPLLSVAATAN